MQTASSKTVYPVPAAHIAPYVDVLGSDLAFSFLLRFGGSEITLSRNPRASSVIVDQIGRDLARALTESLGEGARRVPVGREWMIAMLRARGKGTAEIARTLHVSDVTVRRAIKASEARLSRKADLRNQLDLFEKR